MQLVLERDMRRDIVLGVDVGTTNIRCFAYDQQGNVIGKADEKLNTVKPGDGRVEIVPDILWESFQNVVNNCLGSSHLNSREVTCMGISTQRGTFLTWDRDTGQPYHNFISWQDRRADDFCDKMNSSIFMKLLKFGCFISYIFTRKAKFQVMSSLKFSSAMVLMRLYWVLQHFTQIQQHCKSKQVLFGTIDTWLVWKLTGGKVHATDGSNACVTGFFDPFKMEWVELMLKYFNIPKHILPVVKNTCDTYGETVPSIFGSSIPICCVVGDQQASTFGACCFEEYSVNCTMGTGSFFSVNTGSKPSVANNGIVPLLGWTIDSKPTYIAHGGIMEAGTFVMWMQNLGFLKNASESSGLAETVPDTGGVYFFPGGDLLKGSDISATSQFVGLRTNISKAQIVRSVLESLAFQACLLFDAVCKSCGDENKINVIRMCGGVAKNDFVVQIISDITKKQVYRLKHNDTSSLGAAFLSGLYLRVWETTEELKELNTEYDVFSPTDESENTAYSSFKNWEKVMKHHQPSDNCT